MPLNGVNKLCAQCIRDCKQWKQITIVRCPSFTSRQKKDAKGKTRGYPASSAKRKRGP